VTAWAVITVVTLRRYCAKFYLMNLLVSQATNQDLVRVKSSRVAYDPAAAKKSPQGVHVNFQRKL